MGGCITGNAFWLDGLSAALAANMYRMEGTGIRYPTSALRQPERLIGEATDRTNFERVFLSPWLNLLPAYLPTRQDDLIHLPDDDGLAAR